MWRWRYSLRKALPHLTEAAVFVGAYLLYNGIRPLVEGAEPVAVENAFRLIELERSLGIFHEETLQRAADGNAWFATSMEWFYLQAYHPLMVVGAVLVYLRDRPLYVRYRNSVLLAMAIGLVIFTVFPVAPPRLIPEAGFVEVIHAPDDLTSAVKNDFAAVPSYHFGFVLLVSVGVAHAYRLRWWGAALLLLSPALMFVAIVATANHFFVDAIAGGAIVLACAWWFVWREPAVARDDRAGTLAAEPG